MSCTQNILSFFVLEQLSDDVAGHFYLDYHPSRIHKERERERGNIQHYLHMKKQNSLPEFIHNSLALSEDGLIAMFNAVSTIYQKMGFCCLPKRLNYERLYELCTNALKLLFSRAHKSFVCHCIRKCSCNSWTLLKYIAMIYCSYTSIMNA